MADTQGSHEDRPPPGWPKVVGILSMVFGVLAIVFGAASVALMPVWAGLMKTPLDGAMPPPTVQITPLLIGVVAYGVLVNLLLVVAGFMTVARKAKGRSMHLAYAVLSVVGAFLGTFYQLQVQAAVQTWATDYPNNDFVQQMASQSQGVGQIIGLAVGMSVALAWPVFCIIWFGMVKRDHESMLGAVEEYV